MKDARSVSGAEGTNTQLPITKHQMVRALWRLAAVQLGHADSSLDPVVSSLSPRVRETLELLLSGRCEKEIAGDLGVSRHTVHVYIRSIYSRFAVTSRAELLSKFVVQRSDSSLFRRAVAAAHEEGSSCRRSSWWLPPDTRE